MTSNVINKKLLHIQSALPALLLALLLAITLSVPVRAVSACSNGEHQYSVEIVKQKSETEDGEVKYTCDICGYSYTEVLPATGHHWGDWVVDKAPSCGEEGHMYRVCTDCNNAKEVEVIPKLIGAHRFVSSVTAKPTYSKTGLRTYKCDICGYEYTEVIPMLVATTAEKTTQKEKETKWTVTVTQPDDNKNPIEPSSPAKARTHEINALDIVLPCATVMYCCVVGYVLWYNRLVINWDKKKRLLNKEKRRQDDNE